MNKTLIVFAAIMACAAAQPELKSGALLVSLESASSTASR